MKRTVIGILAHVDAGKTTLSEAMLYCAGAIRSMGRVDHGSAFLDNFAIERARGITVFSKQAVLHLPEMQATLLDTPGHVDFSPEMERTLDVLDCAVLVISGTDGVQSHTFTVWKLLRRRGIPTFIFVNKMDLAGANRDAVLAGLRQKLGDGFVDLASRDDEALAECDEMLLEEYLSGGAVRAQSVAGAVARCRVFPVCFGSALRLEGVEEFLELLGRYAPESPANAGFGALVYKISRDEQNLRLTHMKITGGVLRVRDTLTGPDWSEKITQLRVYSGAKFQSVEAAWPGDVVAAAGLTRTAPGLGLGAQADGQSPELAPVLAYRLLLPEGTDMQKALTQLRLLEEEEPQLHVDWSERRQEIQIQLMGQVQLEILKTQLSDRFGLDVEFGPGEILYRETISAPVEGVGHYEPLRHYAEVHLLLEPGEQGSGLRFESTCPEDMLDRNWQRLILTHLAEKRHLGVLTGSPITDMTITLVSGRAHLKHTEGGDFRQATYRAVRQGLMRSHSILLEPWYDFRIELPPENVGRCIGDLQRLGADFAPPETLPDCTAIVGNGSVAALRDYQKELAAYTHGLGRFSCTLRGYAPCAEQDTVAAALGYDPEADTENSPDSVFCAHGAGYTVKWNEVFRHMHLPGVLSPPRQEENRARARRYVELAATDKELMAIFERTYGPIRRNDLQAMRRAPAAQTELKYKARPQPEGPEYLLVDGYNIIFAWEELRRLAEADLETARVRLIERLRNYQGYLQSPVILVFDAYKVKGNPGSMEKLGGLTVIYTKEAETADMYIEKATYELGRKHRVRVATSDGLEQIIILGHGALRVPAPAFEAEVLEAEQAIRTFLTEKRPD